MIECLNFVCERLKMHCSVCCLVVAKLLVCFVCSKSSCELCVNSNAQKCCFCNSNVDYVEREVERQISLLASTKAHLIGATPPPTLTLDRIKQCPVCTVSIEKEQDDCPQMYCTNCKTVWSWNTLAIVSDPALVHNPIFFKSAGRHLRFTAFSLKQKLALKSLTQLDEEEYRYASDAYTYRVLLLNELVGMNEFRVLIADRYASSVQHECIANILTQFLAEECDESACEKALAAHDAELSSGRLPYV